ncbi:flavonoid O-methyltransferase-like protein Os11g0303600 [Hordeum vulgare subsp. vulgare]|uniref:flavonoid O-methyltransferase-like protein Os11g0303600 n=1 Tax=Hordeum vulgare subsp. vulgare TaxID=112509 RepID=UPI001D1A41EC|nr:flavonoid O-methyltransferase-like protein Os11g0303600 [Hordeum vulgare subsp. vulgare]
MAAESSQTMTTPTDAELVQAQADLWHHCLSYLTPMALRCAVQLGIPTAIHRLGGAASLPDLVTALSLPTSKVPFVGRLLRLLAATGILASNEAGMYSLVPLSYLLVDGVRIDGDASQTAFVLTVTSRHFMEAAIGLADWFKNDIPPPVPSPFEDVHGAALFEESMAALDPECDKLFNESLAAHDHMGIGTILRECHGIFNGLQSLTDCCGGDGTTARAIVKAYPHIKCNVLDLSRVIDKAPRDGFVNYIAGDMFHSIPPAQVVMLKLVLHFWSDEDCINILAQCKKAIPTREAGGKVIIIDIVVDSSSGKMFETQLLMDMAMMVYTRGRQRDEQDWNAIFVKAGFSDYKIVKKLGARGVIEVYP